MEQAFPHLCSPIALRHRTLKSRLVFGAHTANMASGGMPSERHRGYYEERAQGGAAMIVVEPMPVHATAVLTRGNFRHSDDAVIPAFRRITEACKAHGAAMIHQLYHVGQHGDADNSFRPSWSPSGLSSWHDSDGSHAMSEAEIEAVIEGFAQAAGRARAAGFDGIELFAAYHALIDQFWTPWSNHRGDRWGGPFENRVRFSAEICARIRRLAGDDFIVGMAVSLHPAVEVSLSIEAMQEIVAWHDVRVILAEAAPQIGGRFRLAGLQPRRAQILDLIRWYESELRRLGVEVRLNALIEAEDVSADAPDAVVLATGSLPAATGFQRALPQLERLPGSEAANVWSVEDVMGRAARPGRRVVVLDDIGHWHAAGTAWHLAEQGHEVTIVTRFPMVAWELVRTATDWPLRRRLRELGVRTLQDAAITRWHCDAADVVDLRDGGTRRIEADALVLATVNAPQTWLQAALAGAGLELHAIGDCVAPRLAVMAIYEGRELALRL